MKIGILTFHHTANYGGVLQSLALSRYIQSLGYNVEIIDYRPEEVEKFYWNNMRFLKLLPPYRTPQFSLIDIDAFKRFIKYLKFQIFFNKYLPLSKQIFKTSKELLNIRNKYDLVICGSDQIWHLNCSFRKFDSSFFLDFVNTDTSKIASYAASFGSTHNLGEYSLLISQLINRLNFISVRDLNSFNLVKQLCDCDSQIVLDPTFLIDYDDLIVNPKIQEKFLIIYYHNCLSRTEEDAIIKFAHQHKLKIVSVGTSSEIADYCFINLEPREWLGLFKKSEFVFTNTFHGVIFSIIFRRQFVVLPLLEKSNKIDYLIHTCELRDCYFTSINFTDESVNIPTIDYQSLWKKLDPKIRDSKQFIAKILSKI